MFPCTTLLSYGYDQVNRLINYNNGAATYGYNGDGLRMSKTLSGKPTEQYVWDIGAGLPLLLQDGTAKYIYGPGGMVLEQVRTSNNSAYYYHADQLGSIRQITGSAGQVVASYSYSAYGFVTSATGTITNSFGFSGEYTDPESGLIYLRARYYDPGTQQFLTRDPIYILTGEPYGYTAGSPLNATDHSGLSKSTGGDPGVGGGENSGGGGGAGIFELIFSLGQAAVNKVQSWFGAGEAAEGAACTIEADSTVVESTIVTLENGFTVGQEISSIEATNEDMVFGLDIINGQPARLQALVNQLGGNPKTWTSFSYGPWDKGYTTWWDFTIYLAKSQIARGGRIFFNLDGIDPKQMGNILANLGPNAGSVTSNELRLIAAQWSFFKDYVVFLRDGKVVGAPW